MVGNLTEYESTYCRNQLACTQFAKKKKKLACTQVIICW